MDREWMIAVQAFTGPDPSDVALRPLLNEFIEGEPLRNLTELRTWVGALRLQRCNERHTEAR